MVFEYDAHLKDCAKDLRRGMTPEERKLWHLFLKNRPEKWYRQRPMFGYIADFYCPAYRIAIELDGSQHYEADNWQYDRERDRIFTAQNIRVLRFSNDDIRRQFCAACDNIHQTISISMPIGGIE